MPAEYNTEQIELYTPASAITVSTATPFSISPPVDIANGDYVDIFVVLGDSSGVARPVVDLQSTGFTQILAPTTSRSRQLYVLRKRIVDAAGEPASYSIVPQEAGSYTMVCAAAAVRLVGASETALGDGGTPGADNSATSTTPTFLSATADAANSLLVCVSINVRSVGITWNDSVQGVVTQGTTGGATSNDVTIGVGQLAVGAGATGNKTSTMTQDRAWNAYTLVVASAAVVSGPTPPFTSVTIN